MWKNPLMTNNSCMPPTGLVFRSKRERPSKGLGKRYEQGPPRCQGQREKRRVRTEERLTVPERVRKPRNLGNRKPRNLGNRKPEETGTERKEAGARRKPPSRAYHPRNWRNTGRAKKIAGVVVEAATRPTNASPSTPKRGPPCPKLRGKFQVWPKESESDPKNHRSRPQQNSKQ